MDQLSNETTIYTYDNSYRLKSISYPRGAVSYSYTLTDQIQSYQVDSGPVVSYDYYDDGSLRSITESAENPIVYYYKFNGQKEMVRIL